MENSNQEEVQVTEKEIMPETSPEITEDITSEDITSEEITEDAAATLEEESSEEALVTEIEERSAGDDLDPEKALLLEEILSNDENAEQVALGETAVEQAAEKADLPEEEQEVPKRKGSVFRKILTVLVILAAAVGGFLYYRVQNMTFSDVTLLTGQTKNCTDAELLVISPHDRKELSVSVTEDEISAESEGTDTVYCIYEGLMIEKMTVNVIDQIDADKLQREYELMVGDSIDLLKGYELTIHWSSDDLEKAAVDQNGHVAILSSGECHITALVNHFQEIVFTINVLKPQVNFGKHHNYYVGESLDIEVSDCNQDVEFTSSKPKVMTVKGYQLIANAKGKAEISCQIGQDTYSYSYKVFDMPEFNEMQLGIVGDSAPLKTSNVFEKVTYSSSDEDVIEIQDGQAVAVGAGFAEVTASVHGMEMTQSFDIDESEFLFRISDEAPNYSGFSENLSRDQKLKVMRAAVGEHGTNGSFESYVMFFQYVSDFIHYGSVAKRTYDSIGDFWLLSASYDRSDYSLSSFENDSGFEELREAYDYVYVQGRRGVQHVINGYWDYGEAISGFDDLYYNMEVSGSDMSKPHTFIITYPNHEATILEEADLSDLADMDSYVYEEDDWICNYIEVGTYLDYKR